MSLIHSFISSAEDAVDMDGYDDGPENGTRMEPCFKSAWIDRNGTYYYVNECEHEGTALMFSLWGASDLESQGWLHLSIVSYGARHTVNIFTDKPASQSQVDTLWDVFMCAPEHDKQAMLRACDSIDVKFER